MDDKLANMFSTPVIRVLSAQINNLEAFKSITLYADGHDNRINWNSMYKIDSFKRSDLFSYKLNLQVCVLKY